MPEKYGTLSAPVPWDRLTDTPGVQHFTICDGCGAFVYNKQRHDEFHVRLNGSVERC